MTRFALKTAVLAALVTATLLASGALAETKTASSRVTLSVLPDCTISATDIDLGVYNYRTGANGAGTVRVKCNVPNADLVLGVDPASQSITNKDFSSITTSRLLTGPNNATIPYLAAFTLPPNKPGEQPINFAGVSVNGVGSVGSLNIQNDLNGVDLPVNVTVAAGLWKPAGQYVDTINYVLNYTP